MTEALHIVLDETGMVAAGRSDVLAPRLIHRAHSEEGCFLYAPACALVEADRVRPGTAEHLAALPGITVLGLDLPAALAVARGTSWAPAHTRYAAEPTAERPNGAAVATTTPDVWEAQAVRVIDLGSS
ncbi:hypothetical protein ACIRFH_19290 [Streptomyces sp. NPDC093586]|uniref:hypothetical protein n=1 Tax=Streptomyces sp. NPDC093586 TaxID=3366042 RepID=UPI00381E0EC7